MDRKLRVSYYDIGIGLFLLRSIIGILQYNFIANSNVYIINGVLQVLFIIISILLIGRQRIKHKMPLLEKCILFFGVIVVVKAMGAINSSNMLYSLFMITLIPYSFVVYFFFSYIEEPSINISRKWTFFFAIVVAITIGAIIRTGGIKDYYEVYAVLCFMPIILLRLNDLDRQKTIFILMLSVAFISIISNKRTALLACLLAIIVWMMIRLYLNGSSIRKFFLIFLGVAVCVLLYYLFIEYASNSTNEYLHSLSYSELSSSSRMMLWNEAIALWKQNGVKEILLGNGFEAYSTVSFAKMQAHNDFIEFLYDYGVVGLSLYIVFCIGTLKNALKNFRQGYASSSIEVSVFVMFLVVSCISIVYYNPQYYSLIMAFFGMQTARVYAEHNQR